MYFGDGIDKLANGLDGRGKSRNNKRKKRVKNEIQASGLTHCMGVDATN